MTNAGVDARGGSTAKSGTCGSVCVAHGLVAHGARGTAHAWLDRSVKSLGPDILYYITVNDNH
jgi:hypothetical protein